MSASEQGIRFLLAIWLDKAVVVILDVTILDH